MKQTHTYKSPSFFRSLKEEGKGQSKLAVMNLLCFCLLVFIVVAYVGKVNSSSTQGYEMRDLEHEIDRLRVENEQLDYQVAELRSVDAVTNRIKMLGMVPSEQATYLTPTGSVAVNK